MKSYYGTLSGIMVALSESVMKKLPDTPPGGGLMMTLYPVGNKKYLY